MDLDNFKHINDNYGHDVGDNVLVEVAKRLKAVLRDSDIICRHAGDEFVILSTGHQQNEEYIAAEVAVKILESLNAPCSLGDNIIPLSASIGIALCPDNGRDYKDLIREADKAMYEAKKSDIINFCFAEVSEPAEKLLATLH